MIFFTPGFHPTKPTINKHLELEIRATKSDHGMCGLETRNSFRWRVEICGTKAARMHPLSKPKPDLVRRYAFQHPQRAGDIARLLPSSFILRNPRDCKDFQRQAGWNMWKFPAFPAYEHSWYVATQRCWVEMSTPKIWGGRFYKVENTNLSRSDDLVGYVWAPFSVDHFEMVSFMLWKLIDIQVDRS